MPRLALPEPDPDTVTIRLPDGTLLVAHIDPDQPVECSPLRRALTRINRPSRPEGDN